MKAEERKTINKDWWLRMAKKANYIWNNYAFRMNYIEIEDFCRYKAKIDKANAKD